MKLRLGFICNSSSSDFVIQSALFVWNEEMVEKPLRMQYDPELMDGIKEGGVITLDSITGDWEKDFKVEKIKDISGAIRAYFMIEVHNIPEEDWDTIL